MTIGGPEPARVTAAGAAQVKAVPLVNVANALTLMRLLLVPVFFLFLMYDDGRHVGWRLAAGLVFAVASITDRFDGHLARKYGLVTPFGVVADPIADKALTGAALIGLSLLGDLPWWVTVVIVLRELGVTLLRFWVLRHGVMPASRGGKLKTLLQGVAIGLFVLPLEALSASTGVITWTRWTALTFALLLTVGTGLDYVARALRLRTHGLAPVAHDAVQAPVQGDAVPVEAVQVDPVPVEAVQVDPVQMDPVQMDPVQMDPVPADAASPPVSPRSTGGD